MFSDTDCRRYCRNLTILGRQVVRCILTVRAELVDVCEGLRLRSAGLFTLRQAQGERDTWFRGT